MTAQLKTIKNLLAQAEAAGLVLVFHYPRKQRIAINGGKSLPYSEAIPALKDAIQHQVAWNAKIKAMKVNA